MESEIKALEEKIQNAVIIEEDGLSKHEVSLGSTVVVAFLIGDEEDEDEEYQIVGTTEADAANNRISNESPLGKALIGGKKGDVVEMTAPGGNTIRYRIKEIK